MLSRYKSTPHRIPQWGLLAALVLLLMTFGEATVHAQSFDVSGTVLDASDVTPLPGVNIVEEGTQNGATTNINGEFDLAVQEPDAILVFSFVGYTTQRIALNGRSELTVRLAARAEELEGVVVTALGIERQQRSLGYSVSQVDAEDLAEVSESNMANLLKGKVAGVVVTEPASGPGGSSRVTIRGSSSLTGDNQPLYVVDGIPIDNTTTSQASTYGGYDGGDGITSLNPEDVESISVLKGASAAALYGSRARDGVIVITTKSGRGAEGFGVEFSSSITSEDALIGFSDYQTQYGQGTRGRRPTSVAQALETGLSSWGGSLDGQPTVQYDGVERPYEHATNRLEDFYRTGLSTENTVALTGGYENMSFRFSGSHLDAQSVVPESGFQRTSITLRGGATIGNLTADVKANYINEIADNRTRLSDSPGNPNWSIAFLPPNIDPNTLKPGADEDGTELQFSDNEFATNPYWVTNHFVIDDERDRLIGSVNLEYQFTNWFSTQLRTGLDQYTLRRTYVTPYGTAYRVGGDMSESEDRVTESNTQLLLNATQQLTDALAFNAFVGGNVRLRNTEVVGADGSEFKSPDLQTVGNLKNITPVYGLSEQQLNSLLGSAELSYNDYAFLTVTARNDWSSTLPEDENSYFYPSVSGSFVFSDAFDAAMPSWLGYGRVRASWAEIGSDTSPYRLALTYNVLDITHPNKDGEAQPLVDVAQSEVPNADLKPEITREREVGADLGFLDGRLNVDVAWYHRSTTNQIFSTSISEASGYTSRVINAGELVNTGIELLVSATPVQTDDFSWSFDVNYANNNSEVKALYGDQTVLELGASRTFNAYVTAEVDQPYGTIWGYEYQRDENGNIVHDSDGLPLRESERVVLGRGTPDWTAGLSNAFSYKNVTLGVLVDVKWGGQLYSATNAYAYSTGLHKNTLEGRADCDAVADEDGYPSEGCFVGEGVVQVGTDGDDNPIYEENTTAVLPENYYGRIAGQIAEEFVYDANFIKLRQVRVGYRLPQAWMERSPFQSAHVSLVARNLAFLYNSVPNVDPESSYNNTNVQGLELAGLPTTRSIGFNVRVRL